MTKAEILIFLETTSKDDDVGFQKIIFELLDKNFLTEKDIAHSVGCSLPTVRRWADGKNSPHPLLRPHLFKRLKEMLNRQT